MSRIWADVSSYQTPSLEDLVKLLLECDVQEPFVARVHKMLLERDAVIQELDKKNRELSAELRRRAACTAVWTVGEEYLHKET